MDNTNNTAEVREENMIRVGDILEGDFGYSMTLPAFYQVVSVTSSGKSAKVRRLNTRTDSSDGGWTGTCVPIRNSFRDDEASTKRIKVSRWYGEPREYVVIRDHSFYRWDGKSAYFDHWD